MSEGHDDLSRVYREVAREEPPALLDARILRSARQEIARSAPARRPGVTRRWGMPLALAAVIVLSVSVVMVVRDEQARLDTPPPAPLRSDQMRPAETEAATKHADADRVTADTTSRERSKPATQELEAPRAATARAPAKVEQSPRNDANLERRAPAPAAVGSMEAPPSTLPKAAIVAAPEPNPSVLAKEERAVSTPSAPPAEAKPSLAESDAAGERRDTRARSSPPDMAARNMGAAPGVAAPAGRPGGDAERQAEIESPERWIERILQLRKQGRLAEAQSSLEEFRKRYPRYPLPDALK